MGPPRLQSLHLALPQELGWKRSDYVISTKLFWGGKGVNDRGLSRKHLIEGIHVSSCCPPLACNGRDV